MAAENGKYEYSKTMFREMPWSFYAEQRDKEKRNHKKVQDSRHNSSNLR